MTGPSGWLHTLYSHCVLCPIHTFATFFAVTLPYFIFSAFRLVPLVLCSLVTWAQSTVAGSSTIPMSASLPVGAAWNTGVAIVPSSLGEGSLQLGDLLLRFDFTFHWLSSHWSLGLNSLGSTHSCCQPCGQPPTATSMTHQGYCTGTGLSQSDSSLHHWTCSPEGAAEPPGPSFSMGIGSESV